MESSLMGKNAQTRLDDTLEYLGKIDGIPSSQLQALKKAKGTDSAASKRISLGGGYRGKNPEATETSRRHALRGLLLCIDWYGNAEKIALAKQHFGNATEKKINEATKGFFPLDGAGAQAAVAKAKEISPNSGETINLENFFKCSREAIINKQVKLGTACYESVNLWMYLAGITSLRFLKEHGAQPGHDLPKPWTWNPSTTSLKSAAAVPAGHFVRFLRGKAGLHYVISIGNGMCVGNHNSIDICVEWLKEYGAAPTPHTSVFSIAGYLATLQKLNKDPNSTPSLRTAHIVPKAAF